MFFRRRRQNRMHERETILDVKLRTDQARAQKMRAVTQIATVVIGLPLGILAVWLTSSWAYDQLVSHNSAFAIRKIEAQTDGVIAPEQLQKWASVRVGDNLLGLDLTRIKRDLEMVPIVEQAMVERVLPDTLRLRIREREPVAQIPMLRRNPANGAIGMTRFFVDDSGRVMMPPEPGFTGSGTNPFNESLPVLSGLNSTEVRPGEELKSSKARVALDLLDEFEISDMVSAADFLNIDLGEPEVIQVTTGQGGKITFGERDLKGQLRRWRTIHDYGLQSGKAIASLDLSVTNNLPVRWIEASMAPPATRKQWKTPRTRKNKHV
ncbi:MAG TPA: FtsQ-type POTRA domain-containing protein [Verrucomicrobiae bacterium]|nr:FtsQ-type POTRA domain-containing protein [Verrucomicrobiae bacterium]